MAKCLKWEADLRNKTIGLLTPPVMNSVYGLISRVFNFQHTLISHTCFWHYFLKTKWREIQSWGKSVGWSHTHVIFEVLAKSVSELKIKLTIKNIKFPDRSTSSEHCWVFKFCWRTIAVFFNIIGQIQNVGMCCSCSAPWLVHFVWVTLLTDVAL